MWKKLYFDTLFQVYFLKYFININNNKLPQSKYFIENQTIIVFCTFYVMSQLSNQILNKRKNRINYSINHTYRKGEKMIMHMTWW